MEKELFDLIQKRLRFVQASEENEFSEGLHALLTDLYPDSAHFIYELLQNAEDMNATIARFTLKHNGIRFEHNGTKRSFNIQDIEGITNIGHNFQKKNDKTSIGKFGIGFKAVFAYTATPYVHSGEYHFKISDYFVPNFDGIPSVITKDSNGVEWTIFEIPFNNPKKSPSVAYQECLNGLKGIDATSILFLQNIKRIEYTIPPTGQGYIVQTEGSKSSQHIISIATKKPDMAKEEESSWLKFYKYIDMVDDQGSLKHLPIAIAFPLQVSAADTYQFATNTVGKTFIYFPAEKEHSGLRFHINAPFASTVARESVRDCEENKRIISEIAQLLCESLPVIKALGMMGNLLFEVLPNSFDKLSSFYQPIYKKVIAAFQENEYLPAKEGNSYLSVRNALLGSAAISRVIKDEDLFHLFNVKKRWIQNAQQKNSNADRFLRSLEINDFSFLDFSIAFCSGYRNKTEEYLATKSVQWMKKFYVLCANASENEEVSDDYLADLKETRLIRSANGKMYTPDEIYILPINQELMTKDTPTVDSSLIYSLKKDDRECGEIRYFFKNWLDIREYGPKIEIEKVLEKYRNGKTTISADCDEYYKDILSFAKYSVWANDIDFSQYPLFFSALPSDEKHLVSRDQASNLFLGTAYENKYGNALAGIYRRNVLWAGYFDHYNDAEMRSFRHFVEKCNIRSKLKITQQSAKFHPMFLKTLYSSGKTTNKETDVDYTIAELPSLLKSYSQTIYLAIWKCLLENQKKSYLSPDYSKSYYSPNANGVKKSSDSTLIYYLKNASWIPSKDGKLFKPEDIDVQDLNPLFEYTPGNYLLEALQIGSGAKKKNQKLAKLDQEAQENGYVLVPKAEYDAFQKFQEYQKNLSDKKEKNAKQESTPRQKTSGNEEHQPLLAEKEKLSTAQTEYPVPAVNLQNGQKIVSAEDYQLLQSAKAKLEIKNIPASTPVQELLEGQKRDTLNNVNDGDDFFSSGAISNIPKREIRIEDSFQNARQMKPAQKKLFATINESTQQEKRLLASWYQGKCQMCGTIILTHKQKRLFIARNIISTKDLTPNVRNTTELAWNSLCLCPNCAARYQYCSLDLSGFYGQIMRQQVIAGNSESITLHIQLAGRKQEIHYVPKHFLALQKVMKLIDGEIGTDR